MRPTRDAQGTITGRQYGEHDAEHGIYPIAEGQVVDVTELQHLLYPKHSRLTIGNTHLLRRRHVLVDLLFGGSTGSLADVPLLLVIPAAWSRHSRYQVCRMLLEEVGVAGVYLGETPLMCAFGCATPSALVIDVGHAVTEVAALLDGEMLPGAYEMVALAGRHVDEHLAQLLREDPCFLESVAKQGEQKAMSRLGEIARAFKESEQSHHHPHRTPSASAPPPVDFEFRLNDQETLHLQIGGSTRLQMMETLVLPSGGEHADAHDDAPPSLVDVVWNILHRCDPDKRPILLDHIIITGGSARHPLLRATLETALRVRLPTSEFSGEHQSKTLRIRSVPEYYPEIWQRATPLAAWFGAGITAKCVLGDVRNLYTREELIQHGRKAFFTLGK